MKSFNTDNSSTTDIVAACAETLKTPGTVLLVPTETVYGLVCDWEDDAGRNHIYELKQRDYGKPLAMFALNREMIESAGAIFSPVAEKIFNAFCPGPITMIVDGKDSVPVGVRIPDHPLILELLKQYGRPLASTSANRSGEPNALTVGDAVAMLDGTPDIAVDAGEIPPESQASTVLQIKGDNWNILRPGPVTEANILEVIKA